MDIGFVGLGNMGSAMARNLLRAGHAVTVYNRSRGKAEELAREGAGIADRPGDAARGTAVITMVSDDAALEAMVGGPDGIIAGLGKGAVHISMSTISMALAERLTATHEEAGQAFIAAPVLGRPEAAAAAKLFILAAGADAELARCKPLFAAMGQKTFVVGAKPAQASLVKLSVNFLIAATIETVSEAVALTRKAGIDPRRYIEIITGTLFGAPVYKTYGGLIADRKFAPAGFPMALGLKDVRLALAAGEQLAVPLPTASVVRDNFLAGIAQGQRDLDWSSLALVLARNAGLEGK